MTKLVKEESNKKYWIILIVGILLVGGYFLSQIDYSKLKSEKVEDNLDNESWDITKALELDGFEYGGLITIILLISLVLMLFGMFAPILFPKREEGV